METATTTNKSTWEIKIQNYNKFTKKWHDLITLENWTMLERIIKSGVILYNAQKYRILINKSWCNELGINYIKKIAKQY